MRSRARALVQRIRCSLGRHQWARTLLHADGIAAAIESCKGCGKVDADGIQFSAFNRQMRRRLLPR
jgi:hypothetical protein